MDLLLPIRYHTITRLTEPLSYHLAILGLVNGSIQSEVFVDSLENPALMVTRIQSRVYVSGACQPAAISALQNWLESQDFFREQPEFLLNFSPDEWHKDLPNLFPGWKFYPGVREYYCATAVKKEWRAAMPDGYRIEPVTGGLLEDNRLRGMEALEEEMCSERPSVEDFLEKSFGVCLLAGSDLAGWCLSEYNTGSNCEIGIATLKPHQQRGFAVRMTYALMEMALERGIHHLGWDCWQRNLPSSTAARKAGFELAHTYPVGYFVREEQV